MEIVNNAPSWCAICPWDRAGYQSPGADRKYLQGKECEWDAICDGEDASFGSQEHIERAG